MVCSTFLAETTLRPPRALMNICCTCTNLVIYHTARTSSHQQGTLEPLHIILPRFYIQYEGTMRKVNKPLAPCDEPLERQLLQSAQHAPILSLPLRAYLSKLGGRKSTTAVDFLPQVLNMSLLPGLCHTGFCIHHERPPRIRSRRPPELTLLADPFRSTPRAVQQ